MTKQQFIRALEGLRDDDPIVIEIDNSNGVIDPC